MNITNLYVKTHKELQELDYTKFTPQQIMEKMDLNIRYYLEIERELEDEKTETVTLDYSLLCLETNIGKCKTWEDILTTLTNVLIDSYKTEIASYNNPQKSLILIEALNTPDYDISYTSISKPYDRNMWFARWRLPDLVISKNSDNDTLNFDNCLVSVNGLVSQCTSWNDELYMHEGARFMYNSNPLRTPNISILNFNELGNITIVPVRQCTHRYRTIDGAYTPYSDIMFTLPEGYTLQNKSVFLVLAHSLFFPNSVTVTSNKTLIISPHKLPLSTSLLKMYFCREDFIPGTTTVNTNYSVLDYVRTFMFAEEHYGAFFVLLDNPNISLRKLHLGQFSNCENITLPNQDGILFNQATQSIIDYVKINHESNTFLSHTKQPSIIPLQTAGYDQTTITAVETCKCVHADIYNLNKGDYYFIKIIGE